MRNIQVAHRNPPEGVAVNHRGGASALGFKLHRTFPAASREGAHIPGIVKDRQGAAGEPFVVEQARGGVAQHNAFLNRAEAAAKTGGMGPPANVQAGEVERNVGAELVFPFDVGGVAASAAEASHLAAQPQLQRVASSFFKVQQHVPLPLFRARILDAHLDAAEDAEIVKAALRFQQSALAERLAIANLELAIDHPGAGVFQAPDHDVSD